MLSHSYQIVGSKQKEESLYFMLNSLLQFRIETGEETTDDEDVNVYLANLMHSFLDQNFQEEHGHLASTYSTDVARSADTNNLRHRCRVYRTNGDSALISTSFFDRPPLESRRRSYGAQEEAATGDRGSTYYGFAANLSERINRKHPGVTVVLQKLSERFDTYVDDPEKGSDRSLEAHGEVVQRRDFPPAARRPQKRQAIPGQRRTRSVPGRVLRVAEVEVAGVTAEGQLAQRGACRS